MSYVQIGSVGEVWANYELINRAQPGELTWLVKNYEHIITWGMVLLLFNVLFRKNYIKRFLIVGSTSLDNKFNIYNKSVQHIIR